MTSAPTLRILSAIFFAVDSGTTIVALTPRKWAAYAAATPALPPVFERIYQIPLAISQPTIKSHALAYDINLFI